MRFSMNTLPIPGTRYLCIDRRRSILAVQPQSRRHPSAVRAVPVTTGTGCLRRTPARSGPSLPSVCVRRWIGGAGPATDTCRLHGRLTVCYRGIWDDENEVLQRLADTAGERSKTPEREKRPARGAPVTVGARAPADVPSGDDRCLFGCPGSYPSHQWRDTGRCSMA